MRDEKLSLRAYARCRKEQGLPGGSLSAVQRAIASGRIAAAVDPEDGLIWRDRATQLWVANTDPAQQRASAAPKRLTISEYAESRAARGLEGGTHRAVVARIPLEQLPAALAADGACAIIVPGGAHRAVELWSRIIDALPAATATEEIEDVYVFDPRPE